MQTQTALESSVAPFLSRPILVPLDGSPITGGILPYITQLARTANTSLVLLTVVDPDASDYPTQVLGPFPLSKDDGRMVYKDQIMESERVGALGRLNDIAQAIRAQGLSVKTMATLGRPVDQIERVAKSEGCGMIAMSTHGRHPICRGILGSVTDKVIHTTTLPVMTVTPEKAEEYKLEEGAVFSRVIVPLDGSELGEQALAYATGLAGLLSLDMVLARVVQIELPTYAYAECAYGMNEYYTPAFSDQAFEEATIYMAGIARRLSSDGFRVRQHVLRGSAAPALLELAHDTARSLTVMTTHARSGLARWAMGSVAEAMIRGAGEPVLVIPVNALVQERDS